MADGTILHPSAGYTYPTYEALNVAIEKVIAEQDGDEMDDQ